MYLILFLFLFESHLATDVKVNTTSGLVRGNTIQVLGQTVDQYLGIPYAEPPIGELRFAKPKPISTPSKVVIDGTVPKKSCVQNNASYMNYIHNYGEDCLVLNVWSQNSNRNSSQLKPVMFWIHGGGLTAGSIYQIEFNGSVLATHDVVYVAANYRLGTLGFLYGGSDESPGNLGFYDQLLALKWVRENVHQFGGDKNQITIFGESAGGWSVSAHVLSPLSNKLFKRAIISSGAIYHKQGFLYLTKDVAFAATKQLANQLNCTDDKQLLNCLRKSNAQDIIKHGEALCGAIVEGTEFLPVNSQQAFQQGKYNKDLDIMAGVVKDEGSGLAGVIDNQIFYKNTTIQYFNEYLNKANLMYQLSDTVSLDKVRQTYLSGVDVNDIHAIRWKLYDLAGDLIIKCPTYHFAKNYAKHSSDKGRVFMYEITKAPSMNLGMDIPTLKQLGVTHASDNMFVFGVPFILSNIWPDKTDQDFSRQLMRQWTDFAKYGKPDTNWKPFLSNSLIMIKDLQPDSQKEYFVNLFAETCDGIWNNYYN